MPYVYLSTGYRKWGLSNSMASARIISDQIVGRENRASALYAPDRTGFGTFLLQALKNTGLVFKRVHRRSYLPDRFANLYAYGLPNEMEYMPMKHGIVHATAHAFRKDGSVLEGPATKPLDL